MTRIGNSGLKHGISTGAHPVLRARTIQIRLHHLCSDTHLTVTDTFPAPETVVGSVCLRTAAHTAKALYVVPHPVCL